MDYLLDIKTCPSKGQVFLVLNKRKGMFKKIKEKLPFTKKKEYFDKELIFVDKFGNQWYAYKEITNITMDRFLEIQKAERYYKLRVSEENANKLLDAAIEDHKNGEYDKVLTRLLEFKSRLSFKAERGVYLDYCSVVYLINDEPIEYYSREHTLQKKKLLEENLDIQNFFLRDVIKRYIRSPFNSPQVFLQYLDKVDLMNELLEKKVESLTTK